MKMMKTGLVWDERYLWYDFGSYSSTFGYPPSLQPGTEIETPESKRRIYNLLAASGLLEQLQLIKPKPVSREDLLRVHHPDYVDRVATLSAGQGGLAGPIAPVPRGGYDILALATGGTKTAIDAVLDGTVRNAYALVRPPGHHAEPGGGYGLCVFSNVAVAVKAAMADHGLERVVIIDWDVHHGNGTETAFYDDPAVLTISIHQDQLIPGRGEVAQNGEGAGLGCNINVPLPPGTGTGAYLAAFERVILPAVRHFSPQLIVVASGLDAAMNDPTGRMLLVPESYRQMTRLIMALANEVCSGRLVMSHEGGYDPTMVPFCAHAIFEELSGLQPERPIALDPLERPLEEQQAAMSVDRYQVLQPHQEAFIQCAEKVLGRLPGVAPLRPPPVIHLNRPPSR
jgi:acetoin utilization deacetylase AcuC-like enzyme